MELPNLHFEVKGGENVNIFDAINQARSDCKGEKIPVVARKKNDSEWLVIMTADDWMSMVKSSPLFIKQFTTVVMDDGTRFNLKQRYGC